LSAVVVALRPSGLLAGCLASAERALAELGEPAELVVVDNGSGGEVAAAAAEGRTGVRVVELPKNTGFAGGAMAGIRAARGEWVALLNDDVSFEPEALAALLAAGRSGHDIGAVAAQLRFADRPGVINSAGIEVDRLGNAADRLAGAPAEASETETVEVFGASAAAAVYRRRMLEELGGFDESFFAYLEDVDLAWRARMAGWRCVYCPAAVVLHHHSSTLGHRSISKYFLVGRNRVRVLAKNAEGDQLLRYGLAIVAYELGYVLYAAAVDRTLAPVRGRLHGLREWPQYRTSGAVGRRRVPLAAVRGPRSALRRHRAWSAARSGG
jgi:GT2 family glycosyltransferase